MKYIIYGFILILAYKLANNISLFIRTCYYRKKYMAYLADTKANFVQFVPAVSKLFKSADLEEGYFAIAEPVGYGYLHTDSVPHFANLAHRREDFVGATLRCFDQAKQVYKSRLIESFSPLYWVRVVIFLPKHLFLYLGVSADSMFVKIIQLIYWIGTPLLIAFRDNLYEYIASLFG